MKAAVNWLLASNPEWTNRRSTGRSEWRILSIPRTKKSLVNANTRFTHLGTGRRKQRNPLHPRDNARKLLSPMGSEWTNRKSIGTYKIRRCARRTTAEKWRTKIRDGDRRTWVEDTWTDSISVTEAWGSTHRGRGFAHPSLLAPSAQGRHRHRRRRRRYPRRQSMERGVEVDRVVPDTCRIFSRANGDDSFFFRRFWPKADVKLIRSPAFQTAIFELGQKNFQAYNLHWFWSKYWASK